MKLFKNPFKKEPTYHAELQDCLDRVDQLRGYLVASSETSDYDDMTMRSLEMLAGEIVWWQAMAKEDLIRYRTVTLTSSLGQVKL